MAVVRASGYRIRLIGARYMKDPSEQGGSFIIIAMKAVFMRRNEKFYTVGWVFPHRYMLYCVDETLWRKSFY